MPKVKRPMEQHNRVQRNSSQGGKISKEAMYGNSVCVFVVACFVFGVR